MCRAVRSVALFIAALLALVPTSVHAGNRVALVIGNSGYEHLPALDSPRNDAAAVAAKLERLGYTVITGIDLDRAATEAKLQEFWQASEDAEIALFYYAGHGIHVSGRDYLVPIDAAPTDAKDLDRAAFELTGIVAPLQYGPDIGLVFFDAGRDNPLPPAVERSTGDSAEEETPPTGHIVIAFATTPGWGALHGRGGAHSPFTAALLKYMDTPGLNVQALLSQVQSTVVDSTRGQELPWYTSNALIIGDIYLAGP
jgi:uncharacterized caspase-like protein